MLIMIDFKFSSTTEFDMFDEFGELDEHFFDDDGNGTNSANSEAENDDEFLASLPSKGEWSTFDFPDIDESELSLFTDIDAWTNLGNRFDAGLPLGTSDSRATVNDSRNDLSTFGFGDEELSSLIKKASTLFSRSDVEKVAGILGMQPVNDVKVKGYSI